MTCGAESNSGRAGNALRLDFNISANGWGTCTRFFDVPQDWSAGEGLSFHYLAGQAGVLFNLDIYTGPDGARETYLYTIEATPESAADWARVDLRWEDFHRASWEENADAPFDKASAVTGIAFGLTTLPDAPSIGSFRVDDITLLGAPVSAPGGQPAEGPLVEQPPVEEESEPPSRCLNGLILPVLLIGLAGSLRRR
jgi:hypothetical protein